MPRPDSRINFAEKEKQPSQSNQPGDFRKEKEKNRNFRKTNMSEKLRAFQSGFFTKIEGQGPRSITAPPIAFSLREYWQLHNGPIQ